MIDLFGFTGYTDANIQTFVGHIGNAPTTWYNWIKPRNINNVYIYCLGGGGGGGGGGTAAGNAGGGSGGGGGGAACLLISAYLLPDNLFVGVGGGGAGGASAGAG